MLPTLRLGRLLRRPVWHYAIGLGVPILTVGGVLLLFPLLREQSSSSCEALAALERRRAIMAPRESAAPTPFSTAEQRLPSMLRCTAAHLARPVRREGGARLDA
ncbi:hypothetical protein [Roseomonas sp. CECT 9278]|uniref:hypothetical protein n=1 Tax=Roseomonas sp. CECT 9278 TaxID=2845823 RepID=UPI001E5851D0|nr:hypothetical protein [Roseomonas sp. CECT 9278]